MSDRQAASSTVDVEALGKLAYETWHNWWHVWMREHGSRMADDTKPWDSYRADDPLKLAEIEVARAVSTAALERAQQEIAELRARLATEHRNCMRIVAIRERPDLQLPPDDDDESAQAQRGQGQ
jgi:hypothetical protein